MPSIMFWSCPGTGPEVRNGGTRDGVEVGVEDQEEDDKALN